MFANNLLKKSIAFLGLFANAAVFGQIPSNDNCTSATVINIPATGTACVTGTTVGATSDTYLNTCDTGTPGNEVWYTFTATGADNTVTVTPTGSPAAQNLVVSIQSTNCASTTYNTCGSSATAGGSATASWTYTPGTQVWVSVETNGTQGGFQICVTSETPAPTPGSSCATAATLCSLNPINLASMPNNSNGFMPDCFLAALQKPVFYEFTVGVSGSMVWTATPNGGAEFDWALYNVTSACPGALTASVACNYNFSQSPAPGLDPNPFGMQNGAGTCSGEFCDPVNLVAGQTYMLIIDNYSDNTVGFDLDWTGSTFEIAPNPAFTVSPATGCVPTTVSITNTSTYATSYSWNFGNGNTSTATNPPNQTYNTAGTYLISLTATSSTGCTSTTSNPVVVTASPVANAGPDINFCSGSTGSLGSAAVGGVTYAWTPTTGLSSSTVSNPTVTLTNAGASPVNSTYTVTASSGSCFSTDLVVVTVKPIPVANAGADISFCSGASGSIGSASVAGVTYSWSPTTGLSSSTVSNPTITLTNAGATPTTTPYTVTATLNGCSATDIVSVTVNPIPVANAGADVAFCSGGNASLGAASVAGVSYVWSPTTGLSSSTVSNPTVTLTNAGTTPATSSYTVTASLSGCTATDIVAVTVNPIPVANAGTDAAFCSGGNASLGAAAAAGVTYAWSPTTGLSSSTVANPTVTLTNTGASPSTTTYTVTATQSGCTATDVVVVTVNPYPVANAGTDVSFCSGSNATLGVASVAGVTYLWSPSTGLSNANISNPSVTLTNTGASPVTSTYTLSATVSGCTSTDLVVVTVNPFPVANAGGDVSICAGGSATLGVASTAGYSYTWSPATSLSSTTVSNPTATPAATITYSLTVTAAGCVSTDGVIVSIGSLIPSAGADVTICNGSNTTLTASGGTTYTWSPSTGLSATNTASVTASPTSTTTYTVTATAGACTGTDAVIVTVNPMPVSNAGADIAFCSGGSGTIGAASTAGYTYTWSPTTGLSSSTVSNPTVSGTNTGSAPVVTTYTVTSTLNGCTTTDQVAVTINPIPVANAGADIAYCSGSSGTIGSASVAGVTYLWSPATGLSSTSSSNPTVTLTNITGSPVNTTFTVTASQSGCSSTDLVVVTVDPIPPANAGADIAYCSGASGTIGSASVAGLTYSWTPAAGLSNASISNPVVTLTNSGSSAQVTTFTLSVTNSGSCASGDVVTVTVNPIPVANAGADLSYCSGLSGTIGAASVAGYSYLWSPATGLSSTTASNPTATVTNSSSSPLTISYTLTVSQSGCNSTDTVVLTVFSNPVADAGTDVIQCSGVTGNIGSAPVSGMNYTWTPTTGLSDPAISNPTVTITNSGTTPITTTYTVTSAVTGCSSSDMVVVTVNPIPVANAGADVSYCSGSSGTFGVASTPGYSYTWSPSTGLSSTTVSNPTVTVTNSSVTPLTISYTLSVSQAGCSSSDDVVLTVYSSPVADAGTDITYCSGSNGTIGAASSAGYTYTWTPTTGLSDATVSNPTVTLTNTGTSPVTTTYTLSTSVSGCVASDLVTVTVNPMPVADAGADVSYCSGGTGTFGTASTPGYTYSWSPSTGLSSTTTSNPSATVTNSSSTPLTITYTLSVSQSGCITSDEAILTVYSMPIADAGADAAYCSGSNATIGSASLGGYTYSWSPSTGLSDATISNPVVNLTNTGTTPTTATFTVTANISGCSASDIVVVTVNPIPVSNAGTDVTFCSGGNGTLGTAATAGFTYTWNPSTGLSSTSSSDPTVTLTNTGSASVTSSYTVTTTAAGGCTSTDDVAVTVNPIPVSAAGADIRICSGATGQLGTPSTGGYSYTWTPSTGLSNASISDPTVVLTNTGSSALVSTYTVTTSSLGCTSTDVVIVTIPAPISAVTGHTDAKCFGACDGQIGVIATGGVLPYTYSWTGGLGTASFVNNVCAGTYSVTITDSIGCVYTTPAETIGEPAAISSSITSTPAFCGQATGTATVTVSGGTPAFTYAWTGSSSTTNVATSLIPGTYIVTFTDANLCQGKDTVVVGNLGGPTASISTSVPATCNGGTDGSITASATGGTGAYTYSWNTTPAQITVTASGLPAGNYCVTVIDSAGCTSTACGDITEPTVVTVAASTDTILCRGTSTVISASASGGNGAPFTYSWSPSTTLSSSSGQSPTATPVAATTYTVTATDAQGCASTTDIVFVDLHPMLNVDALGAAVICFNESTTLSATASGGNGGPYSLTWSPSSGLNTTTGTSVTASPTTTTTYTVGVTDGCTVLPAFDSVVVSVNPLPVVQFTPVDAAGCYPVDVDFVNITPNTVSCSWTFGDNTSDNTTCTPSHNYPDPGTYDVSLTVVDGNGCTNSATVVNAVTVHDKPIAEFTFAPNPTTILNPIVHFKDSSSFDVNTWNWEFAELGTSDLEDPSFTFQDTGSYPITLYVANEFGCTDSITKYLRVDPEMLFYVPNAFTPNGDGKNDLFGPIGENIDPANFQMWIYDRWGNMIYSSTDLKQPWDGKANSGSTASQEDVYVWKIRAKGIGDSSTFITRIGSVAIIK